nr:YqgE/AlgH family protein [uncultured Holophaga sp.]
MSFSAPCLLASSPLLLDPNFLHTLVLVVEHDENGSMGVILNRPLPLTLQQICSESHLEFAGETGATAFRGGPVDPQRGIILVRGGMPSADDLVLDFTDFVSFRKDLLEGLLLEPSAHYRLFLGYAGWGPGQLEAEMAEGAWHTLPLEPRWVLREDTRELWQEAIEAVNRREGGGQP